MDCARPTGGGDCHRFDERGGQERLVSRARGVPGRDRHLEQQRDGRARWPHRGKRGTRKPTGHESDKKRIRELERELLRKDRALAETAALLVLSKKVAAIYNKAEDE